MRKIAFYIRVNELLKRPLRKKKLFKFKIPEGFLYTPVFHKVAPLVSSLVFSPNTYGELNEEGLLANYQNEEISLYQIQPDWTFKKLFNFTIPERKILKFRYYRNYLFIGTRSERKEKDLLFYINFHKFDGVKKIKLPKEIFQDHLGKGIDEIFIENNTLYAIDNILEPRYIIIFNIADMQNIQLIDYKKLTLHGTYEHVEYGHMNEKFLALSTRSFNHGNSWTTISIIQKDELIEIANFSNWEFLLGIKSLYRKKYTKLYFETSIPYSQMICDAENLYILLESGVVGYVSFQKISEKYKKKKKNISLSLNDFHFFGLLDYNILGFIENDKKIAIYWKSKWSEHYEIEYIQNIIHRKKLKTLEIYRV